MLRSVSGSRRGSRLPEGVSDSVEADANGNLPEDVIYNFYDAVGSNDCDAMREAMTESLWTSDGAVTDAEMMSNCFDGSPVDTAVEGVMFAGFYTEPDPREPAMEPHTAVCVGTVITEDETYEHTFFLIMEDGLWKAYFT